MQVYTIGYEGIEIDPFIAIIKTEGIAVLADVRAIALSRKKGFSKTALKERLLIEGIEYQHFAQLGDPKPGRDAARAGNYKEFRKIYNAHLETAAAQSGLMMLRQVAGKLKTCLLCFERAPIECHRSIVAGYLQSDGFDTLDLFSGGKTLDQQQSAKRPGRHPRESLTAAE